MVTMAFGRLSTRLEKGRAGRCGIPSKSRKSSEHWEQAFSELSEMQTGLVRELRVVIVLGFEA